MILNQSELIYVQQSVIATFTQAGILADSAFPSPLRLSEDCDHLAGDWVHQWRRNTPKNGDLSRAYNWEMIPERNRTNNKFMVGWYSGKSLLALCNMGVSTSQDNKRFIDPTIAIYLFERSTKEDWFKGLARPFFYETARQIGLLKNIQDMHVIGSYKATDQYDFDLYFGMKSDRPESLSLNDCDFRTRKCSEPFNWSDLPHYWEMIKEKAQAAKKPAPTPAI